jgi:hypothetical protein
MDSLVALLLTLAIASTGAVMALNTPSAVFETDDKVSADRSSHTP